MRVLILVDEFFASRERSMLARLEIGLADEGVRVIHAVPDSETDRPAMSGVFRSMVPYSRRVMTLTLGLATRRIVRDLAKLDDAEEPEPIDVVHVFGGSVWSLGERVASALDASLALEVWRRGLVDRAARMLVKGGDTRPVFLAPDPATETALRAQSAVVRPAFWGVHASEPPRRVLAEGRAPAFMFIGSGRDRKRCQAAFQGAAAALMKHGEGLMFVDALAARRAELWGIAKRMGVLDRVSLIEELEGRRDLLLQGDVLIQPEPIGEHKSIVLEAMSNGMLVVSVPDSFVSCLIDGRTATLVRDESAEGWAAALQRLLESPDVQQAMAQSAHQYIRAHRLASSHIRAVLDAYSWMASSQAIPFPATDV